MISLYDYTKNDMNKLDWDGHIHLFNSSQSLFDLYTPTYKNYIGFADIEFDKISKYRNKMIGLYEDYINNYYKSNQYLLATAPTAEEAISIYEKFPNIIKGFGELKLYNTYKGKEVDYKKISIARTVCSYSAKNKNLPVYIHYSLTNDREVERIDNLLKSFPTVPIVLCHCGMEDSNKDFAYHAVVNLMCKYSNLWIDISYDAVDYFVNNPMKLSNLDLDRIIIGSDITLKNFGKNHKNPIKECDEICSNVNKLSKYINSDHNIKKLFQI